MANNEDQAYDDHLNQVRNNFNREDVRKGIFGSNKLQPRRKVITFFDAKIELRQARIADYIYDRSAETSGTETSIRQLMKCAYVPGTEELVFEEGDYATLINLPMGEDMTRVFQTLGELANPDFLERNTA